MLLWYSNLNKEWTENRINKQLELGKKSTYEFWKLWKKGWALTSTQVDYLKEIDSQIFHQQGWVYLKSAETTNSICAAM